MTLIKDSEVSDRHRWYCRIKSGDMKHEHKLSIRASTFFEKLIMTIEEILQIIYFWVHGHWSEHELRISSLTDVDWAMFCREVCETPVMTSSDKFRGKN